MATLSFLGMANIAVRLVHEQYPGAKLMEGEGSPPGGPTTNAQDVTNWRFVFKTQDDGTAFISSAAWGEFEPVQYVDKVWEEDIAIPWPIDMELTEAAQLMQQAGYTSPFGAVTLRWPLVHPPVNQPYYIFGMGDGTHVIHINVGVYDKSVTVAPN